MTDAPRLTEGERRALGCSCTRLDDVWHHVRFCFVPAVETILADRAGREGALRALADKWEADGRGIEKIHAHDLRALLDGEG